MELMLIIGGLMLLRWIIPPRRSTTYGSAHFAEARDLRRAGGLREGFWVGKLRGRSVRYSGPHALTVGPPGSQKGTAVVLPNLLEHKHILAIDPGGENTAVAARQWRRYSVFRCINPFGMFADKPWALPQHGFNPLASLQADDPRFAANAKVLAELTIARTGQESGSGVYFKDTAIAWVQALNIHVVTAYPEEQRNLGTLYELTHGDVQEWEDLLRAMKANTACNGLVSRTASRMERTEAQAPEEFSAIMSTIQQELSWLSDPLVREQMSRNEVDFALLKGGKGARRGAVISVILPLQFLESHAAITRLALGCAMLALTAAPVARRQVLVMIDEAAALGTIKGLPNWLATLRKYKVSIWTVWQSLSQITARYGREAETIISNCDLLQFLAVGDPETARSLEQILGNQTVETVSRDKNGDPSFGQTGRALMFANEILKLPKNRQIVLLKGMAPACLKKVPYFKIGRLAARYNPNPYYGKGRSSGAGGLLWAVGIILFLAFLAQAS